MWTATREERRRSIIAQADAIVFRSRSKKTVSLGETPVNSSSVNFV
jgi:hypothetical protein